MSIHIKEKNRGKFTKSAKAHGEGVQEYAHHVMSDPDATPLQKKRANFAIQAKKWHKGQNGISLPTNFDEADEEMFTNFQLDNQQLQGYQQNPTYTNNTPYEEYTPVPQQKYQTRPYRGEVGDAALAGLLAVDALIPNRRQPSPVIQPLMNYNPNPHGTGSSAIAQNGLAVAAPKFTRQPAPLSYQEMQDNSAGVMQEINSARVTGISADPTLTARSSSSVFNRQQQHFYNALTNPSNNLTDVYRGFNENLTGRNTASDRALNESPEAGIDYLLEDEKKLLQDEYINYSKRFRGNKQAYFSDLRKRATNDRRINNLVPAASIALDQPFENGGKISNMGYKANSPDRWEPKLTIPSNQITMQNVPHPVYGVDNLGYSQMMYPGNNYSFPGEYVTETPVARMGGKIKKCKNGGTLKNYEEGKSYNLSDNEIKELTAQGYEIKIL